MSSPCTDRIWSPTRSPERSAAEACATPAISLPQRRSPIEARGPWGMTRVSSTTTPALECSWSSSLHSGEVSKLSLPPAGAASLLGRAGAILSLSILPMPVRGLWAVFWALSFVSSTFGHTCVTVSTGSSRWYVCSTIAGGRASEIVGDASFGAAKCGRLQRDEARRPSDSSILTVEVRELHAWMNPGKTHGKKLTKGHGSHPPHDPLTSLLAPS